MGKLQRLKTSNAKLFVFVPFYHPDEPEFTESFKKQTIPYRLIKRDRKQDGIYWTEACNDFRDELKRFPLITDEIVCIMNNDISFDADLFEEGITVKQGQVFISNGEGVTIDWSKKSFKKGQRIDTFPGRCVFITAKDFIEHGFNSLIPHYLADYDWAIKLIKAGIEPIEMKAKIYHDDNHARNKVWWSFLCPSNPFIWTIFLLNHFNKYTVVNILKSWVSAWRLLTN